MFNNNKKIKELEIQINALSNTIKLIQKQTSKQLTEIYARVGEIENYINNKEEGIEEIRFPN